MLLSIELEPFLLQRTACNVVKPHEKTINNEKTVRLETCWTHPRININNVLLLQNIIKVKYANDLEKCVSLS